MLGSTIQRELAEYIMRELNDPRLPTIVSITRVKVTDDLEYADVYMSIMGTPGQQTAGLNALKHSAGMMRTKLTKALSLRQAPFLRFHHDEQLQKELQILTVLDELRKEREAAEAAAAGAAPGDADDGAPGEGETGAGGETTGAADPDGTQPDGGDRM